MSCNKAKKLVYIGIVYIGIVYIGIVYFHSRANSLE